jgi:hypothetical protein
MVSKGTVIFWREKVSFGADKPYFQGETLVAFVFPEKPNLIPLFLPE